MYKMNMEDSMQFVDHPLVMVIAPNFLLLVTIIFFVV